MKLIPGEQLKILATGDALPLPAFFLSTVTDLMSDPGEKALILTIDHKYALQIGTLDGQRPAPGLPYRMGIRLGEVLPDAPQMPAEPHDEKLHALIVGKKVERATIDRAGGGITVEFAGGHALRINAGGIEVSGLEPGGA